MDNTLGMDTCSRISLSVIIPVYNAEKYLYNCLTTIFKIKKEDIEILLVDDGSTDSSGMICDEFSRKDARFHVYHKENGGVSSARNFGLARAKGTWVTFVDADDTPTELMLLYQPEKNTDLVCFNWEYTTGDTEGENLTEGIYRGEARRKFLNKHLVDFVFRTPWAKLLRRNIIVDNHIFFDERYRLGEDNLFVLDYLSCCSDIETKQQLGYIYLRPSQTKYQLSLTYAIEYMSIFMQKYKRLNVDCKSLLLLLKYYYFMRVGDHTLKTIFQWELSTGIEEINMICWEQYSCKQRVKLLLIKNIAKLWKKRIKFII